MYIGPFLNDVSYLLQYSTHSLLLMADVDQNVTCHGEAIARCFNSALYPWTETIPDGPWVEEAIPGTPHDEREELLGCIPGLRVRPFARDTESA
jgi:hypothetical protein